jgi:hypothetical protein
VCVWGGGCSCLGGGVEEAGAECVCVIMPLCHLHFAGTLLQQGAMGRGQDVLPAVVACCCPKLLVPVRALHFGIPVTHYMWRQEGAYTPPSPSNHPLFLLALPYTHAPHSPPSPPPPALPPPQAIRELVRTKTGRDVLMTWEFRKQEAVAVLMPDTEASFMV